MRTFFSLLKESIVNAVGDGSFSIAKGAAYSLTLTFFPTLLVLAAVLAGSRTTASLMREITVALDQVLPPTVKEAVLEYIISGEPKHSLRLLFSAALMALLAASGVMGSFMQGFRAAYRIREPWPLRKEEGVAMALVFLAGAPMLAATVLVAFGAYLQNWLIYKFGFPVLVAMAWSAACWAGAVATCTLVLAIIYYVGPNSEPRFHELLPGALLATIAWLGTTFVFGWYVKNLAEYSSIYGSLGAGVALLIWMYLLSVIVLLGAQFNAVYERHKQGVQERRKRGV